MKVKELIALLWNVDGELPIIVKTPWEPVALAVEVTVSDIDSVTGPYGNKAIKAAVLHAGEWDIG